MIPIKISEEKLKGLTQEQYLKQHAEEFYEKLIKGARKLEGIEKWFEKNFRFKDVDGTVKCYSFKEIVVADYKLLQDIKGYIERDSKVTGKQLGKIEKESKNKEDEVIITQIWDEYLRYMLGRLYDKIDKAELVKVLDITVCPYCNRTYITNIEKKGKNRTTAQLDHFIDKGRFPYFAVSFYNLIPVCGACNLNKKEKEIGFSPHNPQYRDKQVCQFTFEAKRISGNWNADEIEIKLKPLVSQMASNIEKLYLETLYSSHKDVVEELLKKHEMYSTEGIKDLFNTFKEHKLFKSEEEIKRMVYGNYIKEEDLHKRPLAKLVSDLITELEDETSV